MSAIMNRDKFYHLVEEHLIPLFSGASLKDPLENSTPQEQSVAFQTPCKLCVKPSRAADYRAVIERSQPFAKTSLSFVSEHEVAMAFVKLIEDMGDAFGKTYEQDLLTTVKRRIVARAISGGMDQERTVLSAIDQADTWSKRLYEGQPISVSIGFDSVQANGGVTLEEIWKEEFSSVLTNGFDTLLISDYSGKIHSYESLSVPVQVSPYAPYRLAPIAEWTKGQAGRIAVVLNRASEILIIRDGQLVFTRRGGLWHFLAYEPVVTQMRCPSDKSVREAVLASCLDASFARTGACIGIMRHRHEKHLGDVSPKVGDHIGTRTSPKGRLVSKITLGSRFQDLDRRMRQELLAIDGAIILGYKGSILAVGAILHIDGGSTGGGRTAAAKELSKYGTGIKVSEDGYIEAYHRRNPDEEMKFAFSMMK